MPTMSSPQCLTKLTMAGRNSCLAVSLVTERSLLCRISSYLGLLMYDLK